MLGDAEGVWCACGEWWVKDKVAGSKLSVCLLQLLKEGSTLASGSKRNGRLDLGGKGGAASMREKDKENLSVALGCRSFKVRARC
jgi:hypothetical protein